MQILKPEDIDLDLINRKQIVLDALSFEQPTAAIDDYFLNKLMTLIANHPQLQSLTLKNFPIPWKHLWHLAAALADHSSLRKLDLSNTQQTPQSMHCLAWALSKNQHLQSLTLNSNHLTHPMIQDFASALRHNASLQILSLAHNPLDERSIEHLSHAFIQHPALRQLNLSDCDLSPSKMIFISHVIRCHKNLSDLNLSQNGLGNAGANYIAQALRQSPYKALQKLDLSDNRIQDQGIQKIGSLLLQPEVQLESIKFNNNPLTDAALLHFAFCLSRNRRLNSLELIGLDISNACLENIFWSINQNPQLKKLKIVLHPQHASPMIHCNHFPQALASNFHLEELSIESSDSHSKEQAHQSISERLIQRNQAAKILIHELEIAFLKLKKQLLSHQPPAPFPAHKVDAALNCLFKQVNQLEALGYPQTQELTKALCLSLIKQLKPSGSAVIIHHLNPWLRTLKPQQREAAYEQIGVLCCAEARAEKGPQRHVKRLQALVCLEQTQHPQYREIPKRLYRVLARYCKNLNYEILQTKIKLGLLKEEQLNWIKSYPVTLSQYLNFRLHYNHE